MTILFFGVFERPYDTEVYIADSLELLGHKVKRQNTTKTSLSELSEMLKGNFDFVLLSKGWFNGSQSEVDRLFRESSLLKVGWFFDLTIGTGREERMLTHQALKADIVFTTDGGHNDEWERLGIKHHTLRQGIFEKEAYLANPKTAPEIVFVGTSSHQNEFRWSHRNDLITWLKNTYGDRFGWYGQQDGVRNNELNVLCASAKVVVGDSVYSPYYWSNRLYEITGRGGFLLFPKVEGLEEEFVPYKHFIPYIPYDWDKLQAKIDYYVSHDKERNEIRLAGFEHCKKHHTYTKRCEELIRIVNEYKKI